MDFANGSCFQLLLLLAKLDVSFVLIVPYRQEDPDNERPCKAVGFFYAKTITVKRVGI